MTTTNTDPTDTERLNYLQTVGASISAPAERGDRWMVFARGDDGEDGEGRTLRDAIDSARQNARA